MLEGLEMKEIIGTGAFGSVYRGIKDGKEYAVKKVSKAALIRDKAKVYFNNEIYILRQLNHVNITKYYGTKETISHFHLALEYCNGGCLLTALTNHMTKHSKPLSEETVRLLIKQILNGLHYLHKNHIIHRDIKAENILLSFDKEEDKQNMSYDKATVKIIDFGFARYLKTNELASSILGTPLCMDPTMLSSVEKPDVSYNEKCDIWSLGILAYQLLIGELPFQAENVSELHEKIKAFTCNIPKDIQLSNECVSFIDKLLTIKESKRPNAECLLNDPFITGNYNNKGIYLTLKTNKPNEMKNCFSDYWKEISHFPPSARSTDYEINYPLHIETNQTDYILKETKTNTFVLKNQLKKNSKKICSIKINDNHEEKNESNKCSTPVQTEHIPNKQGFTAFLSAKNLLKTKHVKMN